MFPAPLRCRETASMQFRKLAAVLAAFAMVSLAIAQPKPAPTERQLRSWVHGAFLTHAVQDIMSPKVALGPELAQRLGVSSGSEGTKVYDALMAYTNEKPLNVRKPTDDELRRYAAQAKLRLKEPLYAVEAGDITLLVQFDVQANAIPFVGQLGVAYQPPQPVLAERRAAPLPAVALAVPQPAAEPAAPKLAAPRAEILKPNGPCVVKPVMSEQDLANCRPPAGSPGPVVTLSLPSPAVSRSQERAVAPARAAAVERVPNAPCEVKPVMSEQDLINCRPPAGVPAPVQAPPPAPA